MSRFLLGNIVFLVSFFTLGIVNAAPSVGMNPTYEYRTFATCQEFEDTFKKILPTTYDNGMFYRG